MEGGSETIIIMKMKNYVLMLFFLLVGSLTINAQSSSGHSHTNQTWREDLGYGMFAINQGDPNGARTRTIYRTCISCQGMVICANCYGTRMCPICQGRGGIITSGYGNYIPCAACGMTGACIVCHGTGKCVCSQYDYPGYMPSSFMAIGADGKVIYSDNYGSGSSSSSSSSSHSSSSGSNNDYVEVIEYAPNYTGQDNSVWCDKCQKVAPRHSHIRKRVR